MPRDRVNNRRRRPAAGGRPNREGRGKGDERQRPALRRDDSSPSPAPLRQASGASPRELRGLLQGIGTPAPAPFVPDPFQLEALHAVETEDVLVTAPTGSGKTWIAREAIRKLLETGGRAWYTSPLKALTNSKYQEFADEFGAERVGILTGDRKENSDAPLIVGTTEIYRNQLFDALRRGAGQLRADLVVLDEAHYLADEERGHVWEEAIILSPPRLRLLLLSATIGNASAFAAWISEVRGVECRVVSRPGARPVPLRAAFMLPDGGLLPLLSDAGGLNPHIARMGERQQQEREERQGRRDDWRSRRDGGRRG